MIGIRVLLGSLYTGSPSISVEGDLLFDHFSSVSFIDRVSFYEANVEFGRSRAHFDSHRHLPIDHEVFV